MSIFPLMVSVFNWCLMFFCFVLLSKCSGGNLEETRLPSLLEQYFHPLWINSFLKWPDTKCCVTSITGTITSALCCGTFLTCCPHLLRRNLHPNLRPNGSAVFAITEWVFVLTALCGRGLWLQGKKKLQAGDFFFSILSVKSKFLEKRQHFEKKTKCCE